jgi:hypothetical protein
LKPEDFPEDLQSEFAEIMTRLKREDDPTKHDGKIQATVIKMSEEEVDEYARKILRLYDDTERAAGRGAYQ